MWPNSSQNEELTFERWIVKVERQAFRRNLSVYLKPFQPIRVVASISIPHSRIVDFLERKKKWITKHMQQFEQLAQKYPRKRILHSEKFPYLGHDLSLRFLPTPLKNAFCSRTEDNLNLHLPHSLWEDLDDESLEQFWPAILKFYKMEAEKFILQRIQVWSEMMQLYPSAVRFKNQTTRWGSCSSKGVININWRLIGAPLHVIDYILVHELAHLRHLNHSKAFWEVVASIYPDYEKAEKWLKHHHHVLDFLSVRQNANLY